MSVPFTAQRLAFERRARPGSGKLINDEVLRELVAERLKKRWSPEQISHVLREEFPDQPEGYLVPETIYQAAYRPELGGLDREFPKAPFADDQFCIGVLIARVSSRRGGAREGVVDPAHRGRTRVGHGTHAGGERLYERRHCSPSTACIVRSVP